MTRPSKLDQTTNILQLYTHHTGTSEVPPELLPRLVPQSNGGGSWRGGRHAMKSGYIRVCAPEHPNGDGKYVLEHILVAALALKKPIPTGAEVHHVNEDKADNRPQNLVICEDRAYHMLLHLRMRALKAFGRPDARTCGYCKRWDAPENLVFYSNTNPCHVRCRRVARTKMRRRMGIRPR